MARGSIGGGGSAASGVGGGRGGGRGPGQGPSGAGADALARKKAREAAKKKADTTKTVKPQRDWRMSAFGGNTRQTHTTPGYREVTDKTGNVRRVPLGGNTYRAFGTPEFAGDSWGRGAPGGPAGGPAPVEAEDMNVHGRNSAAFQSAMSNIETWRQQNLGTVAGAFTPYMEMGKAAIGRLAQSNWQGKQYEGKPLDLKDFDPNSVNVEEDPGYQFRMQEGLKAIRRGAAAGSGARGGATMKALTKYGQDMASQEYAAAYDRAVGRYSMDRANVMDERSAAMQDWQMRQGEHQRRFSNNLALAGMGQQAGGQFISGNLAVNQHALQRQAHLDEVRLSERGLELDRYGIDKQVEMGNKNRRSQQKSDAFGNILGVVGLGLSLFSDRRLKTDVKKVGKTPGGANVYEYKMRGSVKPQRGFIADDVEKKFPKAVSVDPQTGFKKVNYKKVA